MLKSLWFEKRHLRPFTPDDLFHSKSFFKKKAAQIPQEHNYLGNLSKTKPYPRVVFSPPFIFRSAAPPTSCNFRRNPRTATAATETTTRAPPAATTQYDQGRRRKTLGFCVLSLLRRRARDDLQSPATLPTTCNTEATAASLNQHRRLTCEKIHAISVKAKPCPKIGIQRQNLPLHSSQIPFDHT
ncbi:unnamed protein product [Citrullus colocynthis]|uniref:Uncharacterized protein n=1 Tax=Citrullus colocynthis TaxID=252529 RepID=A0ABP0Z0Z3_9ROSI